MFIGNCLLLEQEQIIFPQHTTTDVYSRAHLFTFESLAAPNFLKTFFKAVFLKLWSWKAGTHGEHMHTLQHLLNNSNVYYWSCVNQHCLKLNKLAT